MDPHSLSPRSNPPTPVKVDTMGHLFSYKNFNSTHRWVVHHIHAFWWILGNANLKCSGFTADCFGEVHPFGRPHSSTFFPPVHFDVDEAPTREPFTYFS